MTSQSKNCTKCGVEKPLDGFSKEKRKKDGRGSQCKECRSEYQSRYRAENREMITEYWQRYRAENPDIIRERQSRYYAENRDRVLESKYRYRAENRDKRREYDIRYRAENWDMILERKYRYRAENQEISKAFATVPLRTSWSDHQDSLLLADNGMTMYQKAVELGRTYASCTARLNRLRNQ